MIYDLLKHHESVFTGTIEVNGVGRECLLKVKSFAVWRGN